MKKLACLVLLLPLVACQSANTGFSSLTKTERVDANKQIQRCAKKLNISGDNIMIRLIRWEDGTISDVTFQMPDGKFRSCNNPGYY